ncbi:MAG TPA: hypothetical protein DIC30_03620 [Oceanospirillales bacterium]|nr:hypothetical protein [Oleispira sp.]HCM05080.1 hypothetical protein [Oceanospirillales bacterium]|tara:strand:- start:938 stop:2149 length:1212 start_codon:yes stop_codon:yes gene_type:complete
MKKYNQNLLWISITTLALTACGGSSSSSDDTTEAEEHDHEFSILVAQDNTSSLSLLEEGELEVLDDAAAGNGATIVLGETGAYAAVLANTTVNFVHGLHDEEEETDEEHEEEAHVLDYSLTGSQVITTGGHFAVLDAGTTTFIEYDELENDTPATEDTSALSLTETYPALMIDEEHELVMVFDGTDAKLYEDTTEEDSFACANPSSHGQIDGLVIVTCDAGALAVVIEEDETTAEHTFTDSMLTLDGNDENYVWRAQGDVVVGFESGTKNYAIIELDGNSVEVSNSFVFAGNICDIQLDSHEQDILAMTLGGTFVALDHEGTELQSIALDFSTASTCDDFVMAAADKTAIVVDNNAQKGYELDVEESETESASYHLHEDFDLDVSDIASMVVFHEKDESEHEH